MLIKLRPCPNCGKEHGHSAWAAVNSSALRLLRCSVCSKFFHQPGLRWWFWLLLLFPGGLLGAIRWSLALAVFVVTGITTLAMLSRGRGLIAGPEHG